MKTLAALVVLSVAIHVPLAARAQAPTRELNGVRLAPTLKAGDADLALNGMALRSKSLAFIKVKAYVAGLYLPVPSKNAADVLRQDAPRGMVMQFLRNVDKGRLRGMWMDGFKDNAPEAMAAQKGNVDTFLAAVSDAKEGQRITWVYEPGKGTTVTMTDGKATVLEGKAFADMLLSVYIGRDPPSEEFRAGLLQGW